GGTVGVPPRPGQDNGGAATRLGLRHRGARLPVLHSLRVPVSPAHSSPAPVPHPRATSAAGALLAPGAVPHLAPGRARRPGVVAQAGSPHGGSRHGEPSWGVRGGA